MSLTIPDGNLEVSGFQHCCGINIFYGLSSNYTNTTTKPLTKQDIEALKKLGNGISLIALTHIQWQAPGLLQSLADIGFIPIVEDFYNSNSGHKITLFTKIHHPKALGGSSAWEKVKHIFSKKNDTRKDSNTSSTASPEIPRDWVEQSLPIGSDRLR